MNPLRNYKNRARISDPIRTVHCLNNRGGNRTSKFLEEFDVQYPSDIKVIGEPVSVNTVLKNQLVNQKIQDKFMSVGNSPKNSINNTSTKKWSQSVHRYFETYSQMKKSRCTDEKRLMTRNKAPDTSSSNRTLYQFSQDKNSSKIIDRIKAS